MAQFSFSILTFPAKSLARFMNRTYRQIIIKSANYAVKTLEALNSPES